MNLLVDTQSIIWYYEGNPRLSAKAVAAIGNEANKVYISIASFWEMAIKISNGKLELTNSLENWMLKIEADEIEVLPISQEDILSLLALPHHHKDPFDRIIITQAKVLGLIIISSDSIFEQYPVNLF